jgi:hypothetical protein
VLVAPDDVDGLRAALDRILNDAALLESLAAGAALVRMTLPGWSDSCARMSRVLALQHSPY